MPLTWQIPHTCVSMRVCVCETIQIVLLHNRLTGHRLSGIVSGVFGPSKPMPWHYTQTQTHTHTHTQDLNQFRCYCYHMYLLLQELIEVSVEIWCQFSFISCLLVSHTHTYTQTLFLLLCVYACAWKPVHTEGRREQVGEVIPETSAIRLVLHWYCGHIVPVVAARCHLVTFKHSRLVFVRYHLFLMLMCL